MSDFFRPDVTSDIRRVTGVDPVDGIRLYCTQTAAAWSLQVRGLMRRANGGRSETFVVATARLGVEDLRALRDALDAEISAMETA